MKKKAAKESAGRSFKVVAKQLGIHEFSLYILSAFGVPGTPPIYGEVVDTLAEVAKVFNVSERTVASWRSRGMPGESGCFSINHIECWRNSELHDAPRRFPERAVSNDLVRAVFDYASTEAKSWLLTNLQGAFQSGIISQEQCVKLGKQFAETGGRLWVSTDLRERMLEELGNYFHPPSEH